MPPFVRIPEFQLWRPDVVQQLLADENTPLVKTNAEFIHGEHWQRGDGWIGPRVDGDAHADDLIKRTFTSRNVILEIARRHAEGVTGNEPDWGFMPRRPMAETDKITSAEQQLIDAVERPLVDWWDERDALDELTRAAEESTWAKRGTLRLYIPAGLIGAPVNGRVPLPRVTTLAQALRYIYVESVPYNQGLLYTNPLTKAKAGAVIFQDDDGRTVMEWNWLRDPANPASPTLLNNIVQGEQQRTPFELNLGGRLLTAEIRPKRLLINEQLQQIQRSLNLALSVLPRNIITAGFLERVFLNAQMPGTWEVDPTTGRKNRFVPAPYKTGPNTTSWVQGSEEFDEVSATIKRGTPQVVYREPIPPTGTVEAKHSSYEDALEEAEQVHILIEGAATPSGVSRQEARAGFGRSLRRTERPVNRTGRWLLETVLALAEALMGTPGQYTDPLRAVFQARLDLGPISADDQRVAAELQEKAVLSETTTLVRVGVQDPDAEIARRQASPANRLALRQKQLEAMNAGTQIPNVSLDGVASFIELDADDLRRLKTKSPDLPDLIPPGFSEVAPPPAPTAPATNGGTPDGNQPGNIPVGGVAR